MPTRGAFGPGFGPGAAGRAGASARAAGAAGACGAGVGADGAGAAGRCGAGVGADAAGACGAGVGAAGAAGAAGACGAGLGPGRGAPGLGADAPPEVPLPPDAGAEAPPLAAGNDSRRRRATGASTVDDADFTNSPCSFKRASRSLLVTPSSFASSCTRALPATALLTERSSAAPTRSARTTSGYLDTMFIVGASRCAHEFVNLFSSWRGELPRPVGRSIVVRSQTTADRSRGPVTRSARPRARRFSACWKQSGSGCNHAPRPGNLRR